MSREKGRGALLGSIFSPFSTEARRSTGPAGIQACMVLLPRWEWSVSTLEYMIAALACAHDSVLFCEGPL